MTTAVTPTPQVPVVDALVTGPVATIDPSATLREAAEELTADQLGLLVVVAANGTRGVLSERDIVAALADGVDADLERVGERTSDRLVQVPLGASLREAATVMLEAEIRHLLVHDRGEIVGVVSVRDVLGAVTALLAE